MSRTHKGEGVARIPDKGNIKVRILRSRSFETIRGGGGKKGKINIGESVSANLRGGCTQTRDEFQTHLSNGGEGLPSQLRKKPTIEDANI